MSKTAAYAAQAADKPLAPHTIDRREPGPHDVAIDMLYCGVCHSDLHTVRGEWGGTLYPCVPGHEIVGTRHRGRQRGAEVQGRRHRRRRLHGRQLPALRVLRGRAGAVLRERLHRHLQRPDRGSAAAHLRRLFAAASWSTRTSCCGSATTVNLAAVAPLLCAGITTYSPLRHWKVGPGKKVGIVGLGGLGHMGVKLAHALGAHVVLFTTSPGKAGGRQAPGRRRSGGLARTPTQMATHANSFDFILNTVAAPHNLDAFLGLLKRDGTMVLVGAPEHAASVARRVQPDLQAPRASPAR